MTAIVKNLFPSNINKIKAEDLSPSDVVVALMGPTGSGRSSFIEMATGVTGLVGHGLESFTAQISVIRLSFPGLDLCFVDTPGFDDTHSSDVRTFKMISEWLQNAYKRNIRLSGLLYFHRISDNRMAGAPLMNLHMFENLFGADFNRIVLITTMRDEVEKDLGAQREQVLKDVYWRSMIGRGSSIKRFLYTRESAFAILAPIFDEVHKRSSGFLQTEVNKLPLRVRETSAGRAYVELGELVACHKDILERIRRESTGSVVDHIQLQLWMEEYQKVSLQLQQAAKDIKTTRVSMKDRASKFMKVINWRRVFKWESKTRDPRQRVEADSECEATSETQIMI